MKTANKSNQMKTYFTITLENCQGSELEKLYFDTRKEAKQAKKELAKRHELEFHAGHCVNYNQHDLTKVSELFTNH